MTEFQQAAKIAQGHGRIGISLLHREMGCGYARAAELVDQLEQARIILPGTHLLRVEVSECLPALQRLHGDLT